MKHAALFGWGIFFVLVSWGMGYILWFAYLVYYSRDFIVAHRVQAVCEPTPSGLAQTTTFTFNDSAAVRTMLASGWSSVENWGVWSSGKNALLVLPVPKITAHNQNLKLELELLPPTNWKFPRIPVQVFLADQPVTRWVFNDGNEKNTRSLELPEALRQQSCIKIEFHFEKAYRPVEHSLSKDGRLLGIGLKRATWISVQRPLAPDSRPLP